MADKTTNAYKRAAEEMRAHGLVTHVELARIWGVSECTPRNYATRGLLNRAFWNHEIRSWFYHMDAQRPVVRVTSKDLKQGSKRARGRPRKNVRPERYIPYVPRVAPVQLQGSWSMWPAKNRKGSLGWLGAAV